MGSGRREVLFSGIILAISCWLFYITTTFPRPLGMEGQLQADFWPRVILIALIGASLFLTIWNIGRKKDIHKTSPGAHEKDAGMDWTGTQRLLLTGLISLIYIYLLNIIGFAIATSIFLFFFLYIMGLRRKKSLVIIPLIVTIFVLIIFVKLMFVMLPRGVWIFREVSILIY